jgi:hypothetical protein
MPREKPPTGKEIHDKAKGANLDHSKKGTGEKAGKKATFTHARLDHVKGVRDLEDGQFIGLLDTEIPGDKSGLSPGQYNVFIAKVGSDWQVYAESDGEIAAEAATVVERKDTPDDMPPKFSEGSFCWWVWLIFTGFQWCF